MPMFEYGREYIGPGIDKAISQIFWDRTTRQPVSNPIVASIESTFNSNLYNLQRLAAFHTTVMGAMRFFELARQRVAVRLFGRPTMTGAEECHVGNQIWAEFKNPSNLDGVDGGIDVDRILGIINPEEIRDRVDTLLSAILVNTWTSFESMAGDLWAASVNTHPKWLGRLGGSADRIESVAIGKRPASNAQAGDPTLVHDCMPHNAYGRRVSLNLIDRITRGSYDLRDHMGDLLVADGRVKFTSLRGIRESYRLAFSEKLKKVRPDAIDAALSDKGLDAMALVRNLIAHRAGVADEVFLADAKGIAAAPPLKLGERLVLTTDSAVPLIKPAVSAGMKLLHAVEGWLNIALADA